MENAVRRALYECIDKLSSHASRQAVREQLIRTLEDRFAIAAPAPDVNRFIGMLLDEFCKTKGKTDD